MANRFLETNYYKSPFVRRLKGSLKGLYSFIICDCTGSGIWALDMEAASMYIGFPVTFEEFDEHFIQKGKAILIGNGKYFFPDFIEHQYPKGLSAKNIAHNNIIPELKKLGLIDENLKVIKDPSKTLQRDKGNGNGNGEGIGNTAIDEKFLIPEMFTVFKTHLPKYPAFIQKDFTPLRSIADFIYAQSGLNGNILTNQKVILAEWEKLCEVIAADKWYKSKTLSTISNSIQEIYQISKDGNTGKKTGNNRGNSAGSIYGNEKGKGAHAAGL